LLSAGLIQSAQSEGWQQQRQQKVTKWQKGLNPAMDMGNDISARRY
jgi:hypothetical protein